MNRTALTWSIFAAALAPVLAVMLFFTSKMLQFENSMALAQAQAALEENVRLALWRMDSAAALLLAEKSPPPIFTNNSNTNEPQQANIAERFDPAFQAQMSRQEFQQRGALNKVSIPDWQRIAPILLDRISDILPGATLEPIPPGQTNPTDTRRLASIPARLVIPATALPNAALPWNTPLRISLMIAWACVLLAAAAVARLLGATLTLSARRGAFAATVTHELRTPLTTCRMYAEMLAAEMVPDPAVREQYLQTLVAETDRLGHLVENVLAYSRLERRLTPNRLQTLKVEELIEHAKPSLRRRADQAAVPLTLTIPDDLARLACRTDPVVVQQILLNLVDNACKYAQTPITLTTQAHQRRLEISLSDHGPGLAPPQIKRLFTAFCKSPTDTIPGIGLGLYLSRRLARELGGDLQFLPGNPGAIFTLTLPL